MPSHNNDSSSAEQKAPAKAQFFQSPWSDTTQKVRNHLLLVSIVGILMGAAGIFPKEITALGLKVEDINQRALLILWAIVDAYFAITLVFYCYSDFMRGYWGELFKIEFRELPEDDMAREFILHNIKIQARLKTIHEIRLLLDVVIPLLSGIAAFGLLLWRSFKI